MVDLLTPTDERLEFAVDIDPRVIGFGGAEDAQHNRRNIDHFEDIIRTYSNPTDVCSVKFLGDGRHEVVLSQTFDAKKNIYLSILIVINELKGFQ